MNLKTRVIKVESALGVNQHPCAVCSFGFVIDESRAAESLDFRNYSDVCFNCGHQSADKSAAAYSEWRAFADTAVSQAAETLAKFEGV